MVSSRSSAVSRRSRRNLTYREKLAIIHKKEEEPKWTQCNLAVWAKETFRLPSKPTQATISNLLRGKDKLRNAAVPPDFRSARRVKYPDLDHKMLLWVHQQLLQDVSVTRLSIQTKAIHLAHEMQLPSDLTFSTGWVSSFTKRHQLDCTRTTKKGKVVALQETGRQRVRTVTAEGGNRAEQQQKDREEEQYEEDTEVEVEGGGDRGEGAVVEVDDVVESEEGKQVEALKASPTTLGVATDPLSLQSTKRRRRDTGNDREEGTVGEETRPTTVELLLDWIAVPGSYSRWWLLQCDEEKAPLCDEINVFLRSHGLREISRADIRWQLTAFVTTFQAANKWLRQAKVAYPSNVKELTFEQECTKRHVLQLCRHYERLASVLAAYVDYDNCTVHAAQANEALATSSESTTMLANGDAAAVNQVTVVVDAKLTTKSQQQSAEYSTGDIDDETKAQKRRLFELECARLQSEIETRNIQLVLEKTLARKKLLDAGISEEEVNRLFPL